MKEEYYPIYINPILMAIGVFSYLIVGIWMQSNFILINEFVTGKVIMGFCLTMITLAFGLTAGTLIAIYQLIYGFIFSFIKKDKNKIHHIYSAILWGMSLAVFYIGISFGIIVTV